MRIWAGLGLGVLLLSGCAPKPVAPPVFSLDCARGFEALSAAIAAQPDLKPAPAPGEPYRYYNAADGATSYVVTLPGGAGHPAIIEQRAGPKGQSQTGCPYGDKAGYERLDVYLRSLAGARRR